MVRTDPGGPAFAVLQPVDGIERVIRQQPLPVQVSLGEDWLVVVKSPLAAAGVA